MVLSSVVRQARRAARDEAKEVARVAGLKVLLGGVAAIFATIATFFVAAGCYVLLRHEVGEVLAAFYMAGICLVLAAIALMLSFKVRKRTDMRMQVKGVEDLAGQTVNELRPLSPYLVFGAFIIGLMQGKK